MSEPRSETTRSWWLDFRQLMAERLLLLAIKVAPAGHPHADIMARHLHAIAVETRRRMDAEERANV